MASRTSARRPATASRNIAVLTPDRPRTRQDAVNEETRRDEAVVAAKEADRKAQDAIGEPKGIDYGSFARGESVTQAFGEPVVRHFGGDLSRLPKWRFKRRYFGQRIIVDTFDTEKLYDEADVEGRRKLCKAMNYRYAALGPRHSVFPHKGASPEETKELRAKWPSQVEQLGLGV